MGVINRLHVHVISALVIYTLIILLVLFTVKADAPPPAGATPQTDLQAAWIDLSKLTTSVSAYGELDCIQPQPQKYWGTSGTLRLQSSPFYGLIEYNNVGQETSVALICKGSGLLYAVFYEQRQVRWSETDAIQLGRIGAGVQACTNNWLFEMDYYYPVTQSLVVDSTAAIVWTFYPVQGTSLFVGYKFNLLGYNQMVYGALAKFDGESEDYFRGGYRLYMIDDVYLDIFYGDTEYQELNLLTPLPAFGVRITFAGKDSIELFKAAFDYNITANS